MRPDPRQLRRVQWLPPLRLTLRLPPPSPSLSAEHLQALSRAHARRRAMVGALCVVAIGSLAAGSVPGVSAADGTAGAAGSPLALGGGVPAAATGDGWVMLPDNAGKGRGTLPGATTAAATTAAASPTVLASDITDIGIPGVALDAYRTAAASLAEADADCRIGWSLIAGIGKVESSHGQYGGRRPGVDGSVAPPILGIPLDGRPGVALIRDTDDGRLDYDPVFDRAVGPMQFIPGTWSAFPDADGDGNGTVDPHNLYDAALAAGSYLCSGPGDLSTAAGQRSAVFRYNHSDSYVDLVLAYATAYAAGVNPTGPEPQPAGPPPAVPTDPVTDPAHPPTTPPPPTSSPPTSTPPATTPTTAAPPTTTPPTTAPPTTTPPTTTDPAPCTPQPSSTAPTSTAPTSTVPPTGEPTGCPPTDPSTSEPTGGSSSSEPGSSEPTSPAAGSSTGAGSTGASSTEASSTPSP